MRLGLGSCWWFLGRASGAAGAAGTGVWGWALGLWSGAWTEIRCGDAFFHHVGHVQAIRILGSTRFWRVWRLERVFSSGRLGLTKHETGSMKHERGPMKHEWGPMKHEVRKGSVEET